MTQYLVDSATALSSRELATLAVSDTLSAPPAHSPFRPHELPPCARTWGTV